MMFTVGRFALVVLADGRVYEIPATWFGAVVDVRLGGHVWTFRVVGSSRGRTIYHQDGSDVCLVPLSWRPLLSSEVGWMPTRYDRHLLEHFGISDR